MYAICVLIIHQNFASRVIPDQCKTCTLFYQRSANKLCVKIIITASLMCRKRFESCAYYAVLSRYFG